MCFPHPLLLANGVVSYKNWELDLGKETPKPLEQTRRFLLTKHGRWQRWLFVKRTTLKIRAIGATTVDMRLNGRKRLFRGKTTIAAC